ncbi:MAG: fumarylacetoacetate hydrolase family protein [Desulfurococcaceae archaeon]
MRYTKFVYFSHCWCSHPRVGVLYGNFVVDLVEAYKEVYSAEPPNWLFDLGDYLANEKYASKATEEILGTISKSALVEGRIAQSPDKIIYYPITARDQRVFGVPVNYKSLVEESGAKVPEKPYIFTKFKTSLVGHKQPIIVPKVSSAPDYEVELGVVIGRKGKYVNKSNALDYVAGYTVFNDISFRDWQSRGHPRFGLDWLHGKNMDSSTPVGPYLVTKDEIQDPYSLELILRVNGETRQKEKASGMVFGIEQIIEELSLGIKLLPGDLIATGTPAGVGHARQTYLKDGDLVEAEISGLGVLANRVIKEI